MIIMQMLYFSAALVYNLEMKIYLQDKIRKTKCNIKLLLYGQLCRDGDQNEKLYKKKQKHIVIEVNFRKKKAEIKICDKQYGKSPNKLQKIRNCF